MKLTFISEYNIVHPSCHILPHNDPCPFFTQSWLLMTLRKKPFENIVGKGENAGNQHFSFFHKGFYPIEDRNHLFSNIKFVVCNCFEFGLDPKTCCFIKSLRERFQKKLWETEKMLESQHFLLISQFHTCQVYYQGNFFKTVTLIFDLDWWP